MKKIFCGMICAGLIITGCSLNYRHYVAYDPKSPQPLKPAVLLVKILPEWQKAYQIVGCGGGIAGIDKVSFSYLQGSVEVMPTTTHMVYYENNDTDIHRKTWISMNFMENGVYVLDCTQYPDNIEAKPLPLFYYMLERIENAPMLGPGFRLKQTK